MKKTNDERIDQTTKKKRLTSNYNHVKIMIGAAFLMATSAIGPGTVTQVAVFTESLLTSFGLVIIIAALLNIGAQVNIWRIISVSTMRGQDIANAVLPGLGYVVTLLFIIGAGAFIIGNLAGSGLGMTAVSGLPRNVGASITAIICTFVFVTKEAGLAMDFISRWRGVLMILLSAYVVFSSNPPIKEAAL